MSQLQQPNGRKLHRLAATPATKLGKEGRKAREEKGREERQSELEHGLRDLGRLEAVHGLLVVLELEGGHAELVEVKVVVRHVGGHRDGASHAVRVGEHAEDDQLLAEDFLGADAVDEIRIEWNKYVELLMTYIISRTCNFPNSQHSKTWRKTRAALAAVPILLISWPGTPLVIAPWAMANGQCHSICYSISVLLSCDMNASDRLTPAAG